MSAEMLVDLATSTLAAANRVKELYVAQQSQRPVLGMTTIPTAEDIALAKQKVREAAAGMYCPVLSLRLSLSLCMSVITDGKKK